MGAEHRPRGTEQENSALPLPRMPWHLRAQRAVLVSLHTVEVERVRALVPPELPIVHILPARTIGGLFLADYGPGSDLEYRELIVGAATVWYRKRPCLWVTHLFVDSVRSVTGGRTLLGAPKHLARFSDWPDGGPITVGEQTDPVCRLSHGRTFWLWRQRVRLTALHRDVRDSSSATVAAHGNELCGRWGITRARVEIPETSPLHDLRLGPSLLGLCGRAVEAVLGGAPFLPLHTLQVSPGLAPREIAEGRGSQSP